MKREADGDMGSPQKRSRRADEEEVRLLIPSKVAGSIIGKGGQNITKLRSQYKASITVPHCPGPERMLKLSSDLESICNIVNDVIPHLEESGAKTGNGRNLDLRMMIHQSQAGCIIGKSGNKIKEIREKIGARIKIFSNTAPRSTDRVIQIIGEPDKCIDTIKEVLLLIKTSPIKGVVNQYDPHNYDEFYSENYGGWSGGGAGAAPPAAGGPSSRRNGHDADGGQSQRHNGGQARGGDPPSSGGRYGDRGAPPPRPMYADRSSGGMHMGGSPSMLGGGGGSSGRGSYSPMGGGSRMMSNGGGGSSSSSSVPTYNRNVWNQPPQLSPSNGHYGMPPAMMEPPSLMAKAGHGGGSRGTTQVTIPKDLAGAIIGKGGGRIRKIRMDSGAEITIDEPLPGSNDRIITISGLPNEIQMAQYLLQQSVHNNADRNSY